MVKVSIADAVSRYFFHQKGSRHPRFRLLSLREEWSAV
uniref:Uncharacterized protein n=1 Tax=Klebsiella pneumoniae TaxID=573 RepID=A0A8B0SVB4_KLEPN|nr:hypothetical protein [Klebsiella pneumoniae]